jgi:hypothetical protein
MKLLTKAIREQLVKNFEHAQETGEDGEVVLKLFGGSCFNWLITELDPETNIMMGLCDIGQGCCEYGSVSLDELKSIKFPPFGLGVERDSHFTGGPISKFREYYEKHGTLNGC